MVTYRFCIYRPTLRVKRTALKTDDRSPQTIARIWLPCIQGGMTTKGLTDLSKSLQELEGEDWGDPDPSDTNMIQRVHGLRRKPLCDLSDSEVRLAVSQQVGIPYILDIAVERLRSDPLLVADFYPGDILSALVRVDTSTWAYRPALQAEFIGLYRKAMSKPFDETDAFRESLSLPSDHLKAN